MPSTTVFPVNSNAFTTVSGTTSGTPNVGTSRFLFDDDDATYVEIIGNDAGLAQSYLVACSTVVRDSATSVLTIVPSNSTGIGAEFSATLRNAPTGCALAGPNSFVEVWGSDGLNQRFYQAETVPSNDFERIQVELPVQPDGSALSVNFLTLLDNMFFGLAVQQGCFSSLTPTDAGVDWSEESVTIHFTLPAPLLALLPPEDVGSHAATLAATINPNQEALLGVELVVDYPLTFGFTLGTNPAALPPVTYTGSVPDGGTTAVKVYSPPFTNLTPGTTYYFQLSVKDQDDNVTLSAVDSFTLPFFDPLKGVY